MENWKFLFKKTTTTHTQSLGIHLQHNPKGSKRAGGGLKSALAYIRDPPTEILLMWVHAPGAATPPLAASAEAPQPAVNTSEAEAQCWCKCGRVSRQSQS